MNKIALSIVLVLMSSVAFSAEPHFYLSGHTGIGSIFVGEKYNFDDESDSVFSTEFGFAMGSVLPGNVTFDLSLTLSDGHSFLGMGDSYDLNQTKIMFGYAIQVANILTLTPLLGMASWQIKGREGAFLTPGEQRRSHTSGSGGVAGINIERRISDKINVGVRVSYMHGDFGGNFSPLIFAKIKNLF